MAACSVPAMASNGVSSVLIATGPTIRIAERRGRDRRRGFGSAKVCSIRSNPRVVPLTNEPCSPSVAREFGTHNEAAARRAAMTEIDSVPALGGTSGAFVRFVACVAIIGLLGVPGPSAAQGRRQAEPGQFDYYLLVLSWSPSFCADSAERDPARAAQNPQCGPRPFS